MKQIKQRKELIGLLFILLMAFIWYQVRPALIRHQCLKEAVSVKGGTYAGAKQIYPVCLIRYGMKAEPMGD